MILSPFTLARHGAELVLEICFLSMLQDSTFMHLACSACISWHSPDLVLQILLFVHATR